MGMTRKDFQLIADVINKMDAEFTIGGGDERINPSLVIDEIVDELVRVLPYANMHFDGGRFRSACMKDRRAYYNHQ